MKSPCSNIFETHIILGSACLNAPVIIWVVEFGEADCGILKDKFGFDVYVVVDGIWRMFVIVAEFELKTKQIKMMKSKDTFILFKYYMNFLEYFRI